MKSTNKIFNLFLLLLIYFICISNFILVYFLTLLQTFRVVLFVVFLYLFICGIYMWYLYICVFKQIYLHIFIENFPLDYFWGCHFSILNWCEIWNYFFLHDRVVSFPSENSHSYILKEILWLVLGTKWKLRKSEIIWRW